MRYFILPFLALAALSSCSTVDRRSLADYDDGIYSWDPYPVTASYSSNHLSGSQGYTYFGDDGYNDGYDDGYNDAFYTFNGPYASPYFSYRPQYRRWNSPRFQFYPSYYYGFNSPYMMPYGMNPYGFNPYMMPYGGYGYPYGYGNFVYPGYGYPGYGYPGYGGYGYGGYGYGGYGYGGYNPWGGMTGSTPSSGGTTNQPVSSNISMRRMNLAGGSATRKPRVENVAGRTAERPGTLEEGKSDRIEGIQVTPMRNVETHGSKPSRDEVGRTPSGTIHYANPPQRTAPAAPQTRRPETETRRTPRTTSQPANVQRSTPRVTQPQRSYEQPSRSSQGRTYTEPSRSTSTPSYSAPARSSSPAPSRSTGGRGGR